MSTRTNSSKSNGGPPNQSGAQKGTPTDPKRAAILVAVLGIVYGDIGTSPIYALRECFAGTHPIPVTDANILGILSLMFWSLLIVISLKYMVFVLRADNRGEGGIFALLALLRPNKDQDKARRRALLLVGVFGASLLYGDVMITPAISVLSAVEGLEVATPALQEYVIPVTIAILFLLFFFQRHGTAKVGSVFGPVMLLWFVVLAVLGVNGILESPQVLKAVAPWYGVDFFMRNHWTGFLVLSAVFLVVTGGEALYADLGHFGRRPIRVAWFVLVLPSLLLNYFGQGGRLLTNPSRTLQPFYHLAPDWGVYPLVILATAATIIASQAVISGAFSLTRQAIQLGRMPRLRVTQTSAEAWGQIYIPTVNWVLMVAAIGLVLSFRSSSQIAAAYGISVNATMAITTILAFNVARERGGWGLPAAALFLVGFLTVDLAYLGSNVTKAPHGGWFPLAVGLIFFAIMTTWRRGNELLLTQVESEAVPLDTLLGKIASDPPQRVPGVAAFFVTQAGETPLELQHHLRLTKTLHERVLFLRVVMEHVPKVPGEERLQVEELGEGFYRIALHYGFMQGINVPSDLANCKEHGLDVDLDEITYYVGRKSLIAGRKKGGMAVWRDRLFAFMVRNTLDQTAQYQIPSNRVVELGLQMGI